MGISGKRQAESEQIRGWGRERLVELFSRAADMGHSISVVRVRQGHIGMCACGWESPQRKRPVSVLVVAASHVGWVLGEDVPGQMVGPVPEEAPAQPATDDGRRVAG